RRLGLADGRPQVVRATFPEQHDLIALGHRFLEVRALLLEVVQPGAGRMQLAGRGFVRVAQRLPRRLVSCQPPLCFLERGAAGRDLRAERLAARDLRTELALRTRNLFAQHLRALRPLGDGPLEPFAPFDHLALRAPQALGPLMRGALLLACARGVYLQVGDTRRRLIHLAEQALGLVLLAEQPARGLIKRLPRGDQAQGMLLRLADRFLERLVELGALGGDGAAALAQTIQIGLGAREVLLRGQNRYLALVTVLLDGLKQRDQGADVGLVGDVPFQHVLIIALDASDDLLQLAQLALLLEHPRAAVARAAGDHAVRIHHLAFTGDEGAAGAALPQRQRVREIIDHHHVAEQVRGDAMVARVITDQVDERPRARWNHVGLRRR